MQARINFDQVTVRYRHNPAGIYSVKDFITGLQHPFRYRTILEDISFTIMPGESLGILGRNGSGKSTLLRTIAGIIKPYKGKIFRNGTIAPVLALGVGLELELSGYENINLLLALYGHPIERQTIHSIIEFSGLDHTTLKQAVKCYSSGMLARLSFSIAFAKPCDMYIIDEVLAVGDMGFQLQCHQHIRQLQAEGKSIIFVSHVPNEVEQICQKAILLEYGKIIRQGDVHAVCQQYSEMF